MKAGALEVCFVQTDYGEYGEDPAESADSVTALWHKEYFVGKLHIDELRSGMVLDADVYGVQGRKLFPAGISLEAEQIAILKAWGVTEASVQGVSRKDITTTTGNNSAESERAAAHVEAVFSHAEPGPFTNELKRFAMERTALRMTAGSFFPLHENTWHELQARGKEIERAATVTSAKELVKDEVDLLTFPDVYHRITAELKSPASTARRLGGIVSADATLTARILRLVNSPCYGFPSSVDSIERAVAILGVNDLVHLALAITAVECFGDIPSDIISMRHFWEHSFSCGVLAKLLAGQRRDLSEERFFVAGLLHDIGLLLLVRRFPCAMSRVIWLSHSRSIPLEEAERIVLGYDHAEVGALLLQEWGLPETLSTLVHNHHTPVEADNFELSGIIQIADMISLALRNEDYAPYISFAVPFAALNALGVAPSILESLLRVHARHVEEVRNIFLGDD